MEAHKSTTFVYHMVGVDVGFENPMFACLEVDYEEADNDPTGEAAAKASQVRNTAFLLKKNYFESKKARDLYVFV